MKLALARHPDIAKELVDLGLNARFSQSAIKKHALCRGKSIKPTQTTGITKEELQNA
jgi:hypothetical protein